MDEPFARRLGRRFANLSRTGRIVVYITLGLVGLAVLAGVRSLLRDFSLEGSGIVVLVIIAVIYFIPAIVAMRRNTANRGAVFVINLFLGWTFVGWVIALAMAYAQPSSAPSIQTSGAIPPKSPEVRPPARRSTAERLAELDALHDSGAINDAEYESKRQAIIDAL